MQTKTVKEIIDVDYKEYSLYTIYNRAIPSVIDGLKPVQRFVLYGMLQRKDHTTKKVKLSDLGAVSSYGYHQGEVSAIDAAIKMTRKWDNNLPIFDGYGNFGTRLVNEAAAPRYIFATLNKKFNDIFCDEEVAPVNINEEILTPQSYLPTIPWVLVNGVRGVAVGFATLILPRSVEDITSAVKQYISNPTKFSVTDIKPTFPDFRGEVFKDGDRWVSRGIVSDDRMFFNIDELPYGVDREEYIKFLDNLEEKEIISSYVDKCSSKFSFHVKVNREQKANIQKNIYKTLGLDRYFTENLTTLGHDGKLKIFEHVGDLIKYFCDYRMDKFGEKIALEVSQLTQKNKILADRLKFINFVRSGKLDIKTSTRALSKQFICDNITEESYGDEFLSIPFYRFTLDEVEKMVDMIDSSKVELVKLKEVTPIDRFKAMLKKI